VLLGGFLVHGLQPGPMLFEKAPEVVYGLYGGLLIANIAMVLIGLVILTPCIWLVNRPKPWLIAFVLALVVTGVYSVHQSVFEVGLVLGVGVLGYILRACKVPPLPMVLGVVLGFMIESNYRRSLSAVGRRSRIFYTDKVSLGLLISPRRAGTYSLWREFADARSGSASRRRDMTFHANADCRRRSRNASPQ
jgi:putative tricarboxylic transport membrane protein